MFMVMLIVALDPALRSLVASLHRLMAENRDANARKNNRASPRGPKSRK